jgi:hypothetical protein
MPDKTVVRAVATIAHVHPVAVAADAMEGQSRTASEIPSAMRIANVGRALAVQDRIAGPALRTVCRRAATSSHAVSTIGRRRATILATASATTTAPATVPAVPAGGAVHRRDRTRRRTVFPHPWRLKTKTAKEIPSPFFFVLKLQRFSRA